MITESHEKQICLPDVYEIINSVHIRIFILYVLYAIISELLISTAQG